MEGHFDIRSGRFGFADLIKFLLSIDAVAGTGGNGSQGGHNGSACLIAGAGSIVTIDPGTLHFFIVRIGMDGNVQIRAPVVGILHPGIHIAAITGQNIKAAAKQGFFQFFSNLTALHSLIGIPHRVFILGLAAGRQIDFLVCHNFLLLRCSFPIEFIAERIQYYCMRQIDTEHEGTTGSCSK